MAELKCPWCGDPAVVGSHRWSCVGKCGSVGPWCPTSDEAVASMKAIAPRCCECGQVDGVIVPGKPRHCVFCANTRANAAEAKLARAEEQVRAIAMKDCAMCPFLGRSDPTVDESAAKLAEAMDEINQVRAECGINQGGTAKVPTAPSHIRMLESKLDGAEHAVRDAVAALDAAEAKLAGSERDKLAVEAELRASSAREQAAVKELEQERKAHAELREACDEAALCDTEWVWGNGMVSVSAIGNWPGPKVGADAILAWYRSVKR